MLHMMFKKYIMLVIVAPKMYYLMHRFQICLWIGVTPPMMGAHITYIKFLSMWAIDDLEWKEYLTYSIVCCYIQYHQPRGYGALEFEVSYWGLYAFWYNCKLEITFKDYYHHYQTSTSSKPTFATARMEAIPNHVESKAKTQLEKWK